MEALVHNLNTMHSRAGAQIPFSSINYGTDTSPEGRHGHGAACCWRPRPVWATVRLRSSRFIFSRSKKGVNYNPGDPNYDLFKLACRVSAKRHVPELLVHRRSVQPAVLQARSTTTPKSPTWAAAPESWPMMYDPTPRDDLRPRQSAASPRSTCRASPSKPRRDLDRFFEDLDRKDRSGRRPAAGPFQDPVRQARAATTRS